MTADHPSTAADSWGFALALYAQRGVPDACLTLQDEANVDVMLLLSAVHAASRHHLRLSAADLRSMDETVRAWRKQVVRPLRSIRRTLKGSPSPAPSEASEWLRTGVKANELAAEKIENDLLADWLASKLASGAPQRDPVTTAEVRDTVLAVVQGALGCDAGGHVADMSPAMDVICNAAETIRLSRTS